MITGKRAETVESKPMPSAAAVGTPDKAFEAAEIAGIVSRNLKHWRMRRELSLEALANAAGVSRAMLSQIELERSIPTIGLLWRVARALRVPFAALTSDGARGSSVMLPAAKAKILTSADGNFTSRALFPFDVERRVEFYKLTLAPRSEEVADPHPPGTIENLTVASGQVEIVVDGVSHILKPDDAIMFEADVPHAYRNRRSSTASMYLVMTYIDTIGK